MDNVGLMDKRKALFTTHYTSSTPKLRDPSFVVIIIINLNIVDIQRVNQLTCLTNEIGFGSIVLSEKKGIS